MTTVRFVSVKHGGLPPTGGGWSTGGTGWCHWCGQATFDGEPVAGGRCRRCNEAETLPYLSAMPSAAYVPGHWDRLMQPRGEIAGRLAFNASRAFGGDWDRDYEAAVEEGRHTLRSVVAGHAYHAAVCALDRWLWEAMRAGRSLPVSFASGGAAAAIAVEAISETLRAHDTPASAAAVAWSLGRHAIRLDVAFADWGLAPRTITLGADEPEEWFGASTETRAVDNFAWGSP